MWENQFHVGNSSFKIRRSSSSTLPPSNRAAFSISLGLAPCNDSSKAPQNVREHREEASSSEEVIEEEKHGLRQVEERQFAASAGSTGVGAPSDSWDFTNPSSSSSSSPKNHGKDAFR
ncbi:unnamed protein product [Cyclocybe aegerita]|uniref:Uncharacterized protein n=1 Tax=Cyclocybe aegerita TaxID=1973307 RepID=A0A8S0WFD2_CYCAE|nr:unnamed protein product [Cyclocybe aegerita]